VTARWDMKSCLGASLRWRTARGMPGPLASMAICWSISGDEGAWLSQVLIGLEGKISAIKPKTCPALGPAATRACCWTYAGRQWEWRACGELVGIGASA